MCMCREWQKGRSNGSFVSFEIVRNERGIDRHKIIQLVLTMNKLHKCNYKFCSKAPNKGKCPLCYLHK